MKSALRCGLGEGIGRLRWEKLRERGVLVWLSEDDEGVLGAVLGFSKKDEEEAVAGGLISLVWLWWRWLI